ncbi:Os02g0287600 [Oryza sativa Japonica Group]|uniref:Os02g0287600 protein n=1 Tax=Oryza sativa subsp. japonica TaxID=39947 RepID=A0A0N7KF41_ORYSJ|nr:Os02g0287600 [Oryza sativa Japonica Group]
MAIARVRATVAGDAWRAAAAATDKGGEGHSLAATGDGQEQWPHGKRARARAAAAADGGGEGATLRLPATGKSGCHTGRGEDAAGDGGGSHNGSNGRRADDGGHRGMQPRVEAWVVEVATWRTLSEPRRLGWTRASD